MFQWSIKNKSIAKTQHRFHPKNDYTKISDELLVEEISDLKSENQPDLLGTLLKVFPRPSKEIYTRLNENMTITNEKDLPETQLKVSSQPSKEIAISLDKDPTELQIRLIDLT